MTRPPVSSAGLFAGYYAEWWQGHDDAANYQQHTTAQVAAFRDRAKSRASYPNPLHTAAYNDGLAYGLAELISIEKKG